YWPGGLRRWERPNRTKRTTGDAISREAERATNEAPAGRTRALQPDPGWSALHRRGRALLGDRPVRDRRAASRRPRRGRPACGSDVRSGVAVAELDPGPRPGGNL